MIYLASFTSLFRYMHHHHLGKINGPTSLIFNAFSCGVWDISRELCLLWLL